MKGDRYEHAIYRMGSMYSRDGIIPPLKPPRGDKKDKQGAVSDRPNRQENHKEESYQDLDEEMESVQGFENEQNQSFKSPSQEASNYV